MPKQIDQRDQPDACLSRSGGDGFHIPSGERVLVSDFGMAGEPVPVIELHHQDIHAFFGERVTYKVKAEGDLFGFWSSYMEASDGQRYGAGKNRYRSRPEKECGEKEADDELHGSSLGIRSHRLCYNRRTQ